MKIVQVIDWLIFGGTQKMMLHLIKKLRLLGIDVTVVSLRSSSEPSIVQELEAMGVRVVYFPFPKLFSPRAFIDLVSFLRKEKFDLMQANLTYSNIMGGLSGWLVGIPVIASLRNVGGDPRDYSFKREFLETISLKYFCKRIFANGYAVAEHARKRLGNTRIDVIPNAVDLVTLLPTEERIKLRTEIVSDPTCTIIFSAGRFDVRKGFDVLIRAFAQVHEKFSKTVLVIAGDGDLRDELRSLISDLGVRDNVVLLGFRSDVQALLSSVDIYVNSSFSEGMAVSILEAMSAKLPVIATSVGDTPNVIAPNTGLLVSPNKVNEIADSLNYLLRSPDIRHSMGVAAREHISQNFGFDLWLYKILKLYSDLTPKILPFLNTQKNNLKGEIS